MVLTGIGCTGPGDANVINAKSPGPPEYPSGLLS